MPDTHDSRGFPAYYMRYGVAYVAWFCEHGGPELFLEWGSEPHEDHVHSHLAAIGTEARPGETYVDVGHERCCADTCPRGGHD